MNLKTIILLAAFIFVQSSQGREKSRIHTEIVSTARAFVLQQVGTSTNIKIEAGSIDSRLKFKPCTQPLQAYLPGGSQLRGNTTVGVQCLDDKGWQYFLPVRVSVYEEVIVAVKPIPRGHRIESSDVELKEIDVSQIRGSVFYNKEAIVGSLAKRAIRQNTMVKGRSVCLVCKGDRVKIVAKNAGINVAMKGLALQDGREGDLILVKNLSSSRKLEAQVTRPGQVDVVF